MDICTVTRETTFCSEVDAHLSIVYYYVDIMAQIVTHRHRNVTSCTFNLISKIYTISASLVVAPSASLTTFFLKKLKDVPRGFGFN